MHSGFLSFSIIVPTYARPIQLGHCVRSLAELRYPRELFEVLVVDDGGETPLESVVAPYRARLDLTLIRQAHAGPAAARNRAAAVAKGRFLAFTDDDCTPSPDWLGALAERLASTPDQIVGGRTVNGLEGNLYSTMSQAIVDIVYAHYNADPGCARFFASNNFAVAKRYFEAIGGFDETFFTSEDRELCDRWLHHGYRMTYAPDAVVYHAHPLTLRSFWHQHFSYGRGAFRFHQLRARRGWGYFRPEAKFYTRLLRYPLSYENKRLAVALAVPLLISQVANAAGFAWGMIDQKFWSWR